MRWATASNARAGRAVAGSSGSGIGERVAGDDVQRRVEQQQEAGTTGVDDAGVLEHRQQFGRVVERPLAGLARRTQHVDERRTLGRPRPCAASAHSRTTVRIVPSIGLQHRLVGAGRGRLQRLGELGPRSPSARCCRALVHVEAKPRRIWLRMTPLLPRAPISEPWLIASHVATEIVGLGGVHLGDDGIERASHVRAGVAVGHRVHVQPVEAAGMGPHGVAERRDDVAQGHACRTVRGWARRRHRNGALARPGLDHASSAAAGRSARRLWRSDAGSIATVGLTASFAGDILQENVMASKCEVCGKGPSWGMSVSHSHRRTKRRWNPNIQRVRACVERLAPSASTSAPAASSPARSSRPAEARSLLSTTRCRPAVMQGVIKAYDPSTG